MGEKELKKRIASSFKRHYKDFLIKWAIGVDEKRELDDPEFQPEFQYVMGGLNAVVAFLDKEEHENLKREVVLGLTRVKTRLHISQGAKDQLENILNGLK